MEKGYGYISGAMKSSNIRHNNGETNDYRQTRRDMVKLMQTAIVDDGRASTTLTVVRRI